MSDYLIIHDRMLVVDSINFDDDLINNMNKLAQRHSFPIIRLWDIFRYSWAAKALVRGPFWPKPILNQADVEVLNTC